jgi:hypothetical protein
VSPIWRGPRPSPRRQTAPICPSLFHSSSFLNIIGRQAFNTLNGKDPLRKRQMTYARASIVRRSCVHPSACWAAHHLRGWEPGDAAVVALPPCWAGAAAMHGGRVLTIASCVEMPRPGQPPPTNKHRASGPKLDISSAPGRIAVSVRSPASVAYPSSHVVVRITERSIGGGSRDRGAMLNLPPPMTVVRVDFVTSVLVLPWR